MSMLQVKKLSKEQTEGGLIEKVSVCYFNNLNCFPQQQLMAFSMLVDYMSGSIFH